MTAYLCESCGKPLPKTDRDGVERQHPCVSCGLVHGDPCEKCGREGLHAPGCLAQRLYGNAVGPRRPIAYGVRWGSARPGFSAPMMDGDLITGDPLLRLLNSGFSGRIDRRWDRDAARRAAVDHARDRQRQGEGRAVEVFALFANGDTESHGACEWDVGAGFVRWFKTLKTVAP